MDELLEKRVDSKIIFAGKILKLRCDKVTLPNGREASREVVEHPGAVAVVPVTDDGRVLLVRQYRYPVDRIMLEIPAGKLDFGENPDDCALRELEEETGYAAGNLEKLTSFYSAPGFTDEILHLYLARGLTKTQQKLDGDEFLKVESYSSEEIRSMLTDGTISDAKSLVGLLLTGY